MGSIFNFASGILTPFRFLIIPPSMTSQVKTSPIFSFTTILIKPSSISNSCPTSISSTILGTSNSMYFVSCILYLVSFDFAISLTATISPVFISISFSTAVRIRGPCKSARIPIEIPISCESSRIIFITLPCHS